MNPQAKIKLIHNALPMLFDVPKGITMYTRMEDKYKCIARSVALFEK